MGKLFSDIASQIVPRNEPGRLSRTEIRMRNTFHDDNWEQVFLLSTDVFDLMIEGFSNPSESHESITSATNRQSWNIKLKLG
jgi:hypothetical protein